MEQVVKNNWKPNVTLYDTIKNLIFPSLEEWNIRCKQDRLMTRIAEIQRKLTNDRHVGLFKLEKRL